MLQFLVVEHRAEQSESILLVLRLVTGFRVLDENFFLLASIGVFILIPQSDARLHLVHILSTSTARTEGVPRDSCLLNLHIDGVVHQRSHEHAGERSHALSLGIVGTDPDESVHAALTLQITVSHIAHNLHRHGFDAGILTILEVADSHLIAVLLGISLIHSHEHLCPVLCLSTTCTGIDLEYGIHIVRFALQHVFQLQILDELERLSVVFVHFLLSRHLLLIEVERHLRIFRCRLHLVITVNPLLEGFHLLHLRLGSLLIIPKSRSLSTEFLLLHLDEFTVNLQVAAQRFRPVLNVLQLFCCNHKSLKFGAKLRKKNQKPKNLKLKVSTCCKRFKSVSLYLL